MKIKKSEFYNYDSNRNYLLCRGRIALFNTLKILNTKAINLPKTLKSRMASYVDGDGKLHTFKNFPMLFQHLESIGFPIKATQCFSTGPIMAYPLFTIPLKEIPTAILEVEEEAKEAAVMPTLNEVEVKTSVEQEQKQEMPLKDESDVQLDLEYAASLYNENDKRKSKDLLVEYASRFGIDIPKNKKFEEMIEILAEKL